MFVPSPPAASAHETRVLALYDAQGVDAVIFSLKNEDLRQAEFERRLVSGDRILVYAFDYDVALDDLGLVAGSLPAAGPDERPCALGAPSVVRQAEVIEGTVGDWITIVISDVRAPVVAHMFYDAEACTQVSLCRELRSSRMMINDRQNIETILALDDEMALIGTRSQRFVTVTRDDVVARPSLDGAPGHAGALAKDGTLWLGGQGGRVAYGPMFGPMTEVNTGLEGHTVEALHVAPDGLVYAIASTQTGTSSRLLAYDGEWSVLAGREHREGVIATSNAAIVQTRDGKVVAIDGGPLVWLTDASLEVVEIAPDQANQYTAIAIHPTLGVVLGNDLGQIHSNLDPRNDRWIRRGDTIGRTVEMLGVYDGIVLYGGANGLLHQYIEGSAICPLEVSVGVDLNLMAVVGDRIVMGGGNAEFERSNQVAWVELRR